MMKGAGRRKKGRGRGKESEDDDGDYLSARANHYLDRLWAKRFREGRTDEWRRWKRKEFVWCLNVLASCECNSNNYLWWICSSIFLRSLSYIYIYLIAIMTRFLIVLVEPEFLPACFLLELVLEICTFEICVHVFVHVFQLILYTLESPTPKMNDKIMSVYLRFPNASAWHTCLENMQPDF